MTPEEIEDLRFLAKNTDRLNEEGQKRLEELRGKIPGDPGFFERQAIFAGRGAMDTYQGAKQRALQALDSQSAQDYTARVNQELQQLEPLRAGYPTESTISEFIGNAASVPMLGIAGSLPTRLGFSGLLGGGMGAAQYDPTGQPGTAVENALWGAGGAMGLEGLASGLRFGATRRGGMPAPAPEITPPSLGTAASVPPRRFDYFNPEFRIPYTEGQWMEDLARQQIEQRTLHGAFGDPAGADLRSALDYQQQRATDALRETGAGMTAQRGGQQLVPYIDEAPPMREYESLQDAGATLKSRLSDRANMLWRDIGEAFNISRAAGARIPADDARQVVTNVVEAITPYDAKAMAADPKNYPVLSNVSDRLQSFIPDAVEGQPPAAMDAEGLHAMRRILSEERRAKDIKPTEKRIIGDMLETLDQEMLRLIDQGRLIGPEEAITAMQRGIKLRADYGKLYGPRGKLFRSGRNVGDKAGEAIERIIEEDVDGETVANIVFGRGKLGSSDKTTEILKRVKKSAGQDSEEYQALRNMAFEKLADDVMTAGKDVISPQKLSTAWKNLRRKRSSLLRELYSPDEISKIDRLVEAVEKTRYMDEAMNRSGTAHMLEAMFNSVPTVLGAITGGAAAGPVGAAGGAAGMWIAKSVGQDIKDRLGKVFGVRTFEKSPRALPPSPGAAAAVRYKEYLRNPRRMQGGRQWRD